MMTKVMFVCLGNICRSTMAQSVFSDMVKKLGLENEFYIDSSGTSYEEEGNPVHHGTVTKLKSLGIPVVPHKAKRLERSDYGKFDYILAMEQSNIKGIMRIIGDDPQNKVRRLLDFSEKPRDIADPWFTGNFDVSYEDIREGAEAFLRFLGCI